MPMAKGIRKLSSWIEVAPAPIIYPKKPSNTPTLETITEEEEAAAEGFENGDGQL
ncbi:hypothetical protein AAZX31_03G162000 [Glycine max]|uniref:Uncharacterized protein n=2 Tax=Glycine subgen. Soja TaxID=1462606 RepID=K7KFS8_SOYBN|nr:hypothetical protein JHK87_007677 [Glycine soja]KAH1070610.1 hypothetical protein GYH30_007602 [Glycine max]KHN09501.1 hypothetical protein glysoja_016600 [Glycine soja]KRH67689.1 hypothetical protein GLYMA_03G181000v4 [Glycine max]RZC21279.1 hypothetical protein D0Y65_007515 [Glycine soja]